MMRSVLILALSLLLIQPSYAQSKDLKKKIATIDTMFNSLAAQIKFSGSIYIMYKGQVVADTGFGFSIFDKDSLCRTTTFHKIGSVTKTFTSTAILLLQQDSLLHVSDPLSKYIPDYPKGDSITIEHLLTHTSGIYNYTADDAYMQHAIMFHIDVKDLIARFKDIPLQFTPGTQYDYSNSNYILLGYIIEQITGKSYFAAIREMIFEPLGMKRSGFNYSNFATWEKASGYLVMRPGRVTPSPPVDSSLTYAASAMYSTTHDMYKWAQAVMSHKLLSKELWAKAHTNYMNDYGYGWIVRENDSAIGKAVIGHNGVIHGFRSEFYMVPEDSTVIIILGNDMSDNVARAAQTVLYILYDVPHASFLPKSAIQLPAKQLEEYEGRYALAENFDIHVYTQSGQLWGQGSKQLPFQLYNYKKDHFFITEIEAEISFVRDKKGKITHMVLHQNGQDIKGRKWQ